jgi:hypothetical protein
LGKFEKNPPKQCYAESGSTQAIQSARAPRRCRRHRTLVRWFRTPKPTLGPLVRALGNRHATAFLFHPARATRPRTPRCPTNHAPAYAPLIAALSRHTPAMPWPYRNLVALACKEAPPTALCSAIKAFRLPLLTRPRAAVIRHWYPSVSLLLCSTPVPPKHD